MSAPKNCETIRPLLSAYIDAEVTEAEAISVEAHVPACAECASHLAFLRLSQAVLSRPAEIAPPAALRARIAAATYARPTLLRRALAWLRPAPVRLALGTAVAAGVVAAAIVLRSPSVPVPATGDPVVVLPEPGAAIPESGSSPVPDGGESLSPPVEKSHPGGDTAAAVAVRPPVRETKPGDVVAGGTGSSVKTVVKTPEKTPENRGTERSPVGITPTVKGAIPPKESVPVAAGPGASPTMRPETTVAPVETPEPVVAPAPVPPREVAVAPPPAPVKPAPERVATVTGAVGEDGRIRLSRPRPAMDEVLPVARATTRNETVRAAVLSEPYLNPGGTGNFVAAPVR